MLHAWQFLFEDEDQKASYISELTSKSLENDIVWDKKDPLWIVFLNHEGGTRDSVRSFLHDFLEEKGFSIQENKGAKLSATMHLQQGNRYSSSHHLTEGGPFGFP